MATNSEQHYSLRWNDYTVKIVTAFQSLREEEDFVDVTVACDGHHYSAHKMVLSACSPYFRSLLRANPCQHPIVILKDVGHIEMERLLEFMYNGEVNIAQDHLAAFLKTAESLRIRGLAGSSEEIDQNISRDSSQNIYTTGSIPGRSSPNISFSHECKDDEITSDGVFHISSPTAKRRKRASETHLITNVDNSTSHTNDSLTGDSLIDESTGTDTVLELEDHRLDRRELKSEPSDALGEVYSNSSDLSHEHHHDVLPGPSGSIMVNQDDGLASNDVSALMAIANAVQATAPSDRPIKCPLCQSIIKHARNLRRHVFKRHLPAAQRGEITEADVKNVLERKLKMITVTPLTDDELNQVQQRTRRKGMKLPRKLKGVAALPSDVNVSNINESEITIRKLPQKKKQATLTLVTSVLTTLEPPRQHHDPSPHEDILQEALAARDKDPQEEVMDLATSQLPPISVVVSHTGLQDGPHPVALTVSQTGGVRIQTETGIPLPGGLRLQPDTGLHRELATMPAMAFEPQVSISETTAAAYHTSIPQSSSPSSPSNYMPAPYWSAPGMATLPTATFQPHQSVFTHTNTEYFATSMHMARPSSLERMPQHRRKPYQ